MAEEKPEEKPETAEQAPAEEKKEETADFADKAIANHEEDAPKVEVVSEGEVKGEEKPEGEKVDPWKMVGNATLTPCGPGVITQLTEDGRAAVLFVASCVLTFRSYV